MRLVWSSKALSDLGRLYAFLAPVNRRAASDIVRGLRAGARRLPGRPRIGERIEGIEEREVRRVFVGQYEMRYEVTKDFVAILRIWHTREDR